MKLKMLWKIFTIYCIITTTSALNIRNASVSWDMSNNKFVINKYAKKDAVAVGSFLDNIAVEGWSYLSIKTEHKVPDQVQAYAAGLVEGYLTRDLLKKQWGNTVATYCSKQGPYCKRLMKFLTDNLNYMNEKIKKERHSSPYWHQVALILEQLGGLEDGAHNRPKSPRTNLNVKGMLLMNVNGDLEDLEIVLNSTAIRRPFGGGSCSALIKVLDGNEDIFFAHDTWTSYNTMLRILKKYDFGFHTEPGKGQLIPGNRTTFSSQPGLMGSGDDFYLISSGLATMETTIGNGNASLWKFVKSNGTVLEWIRSLVANRLANNGEQWTKLFSLENSGTYNNQWMVLDYKKFYTGKNLTDNLLWVSEQLPGHIHNSDVSDVLRKQGYWASYNVPFYKDIFKMSGQEDRQKKHGDWFSYDMNPRARIFRRDQANISNVDSMIKLMRYNNYTTDPFSRCNCTPPYSAENAIAARCDLNPKDGVYPFAALGHRPHGATDMKLTSADMFKDLNFIAVAGPTHDPLPPFQWSKSDYDKTLKHAGHPDKWEFYPISFNW